MEQIRHNPIISQEADFLLINYKAKGEENEKHKLILFSANAPLGSITSAAYILTKFYLKDSHSSLKDFKQDKKSYNYTWYHEKTNEKIISKPINYLIFSEYLRKEGLFDSTKFNLPLMKCSWLDRSVSVGINVHFTDMKNETLKIKDGTLKQEYGINFPLDPALDREGFSFTSFQSTLTKNVLQLRNKLVDKSDECLSVPWILDLRNLINDIISILDITLHQLYIKAEFDPLPRWKKGINLGRKNIKINDKLSWIDKITGKQFNYNAEYDSLERLRMVRNHFSHFDPPTILMSIEEIVIWLNDILKVAYLIIKIRETLNVPVSIPLINLLIQHEVFLNPEKTSTKRSKLIKGETGYSSCLWKEDVANWKF